MATRPNQKERMRLYYQANRERLREQHKAYYASHKVRIYEQQGERRALYQQRIADIKVAQGCVRCGYNVCAAALDFHHANGDKLFKLSKTLAWATVEAEMSKCEVLCANCHRELHDKERHG